TAARPREPSSSVTSTSTVGLPRLSRISRPMLSVMAVMVLLERSGTVYRAASVFSSEADTGSRQESASKQVARAFSSEVATGSRQETRQTKMPEPFTFDSIKGERLWPLVMSGGGEAGYRRWQRQNSSS